VFYYLKWLEKMAHIIAVKRFKIYIYLGEDDPRTLMVLTEPRMITKSDSTIKLYSPCYIFGMMEQTGSVNRLQVHIKRCTILAANITLNVAFCYSTYFTILSRAHWSLAAPMSTHTSTELVLSGPL